MNKETEKRREELIKVGDAMAQARKEGYPLKPTEREKRILDSLQKLEAQAAENLRDIGGCDHSVGICCCRWVRELEDAQEILKEFGR